MKLSQLKPTKHIPANPARPAKTRLLVNIKQMRESRGITLRQVEKAIKVSNPALCQIENGCTPRLDIALKIANFLELPVEKIWGLKK